MEDLWNDFQVDSGLSADYINSQLELALHIPTTYYKPNRKVKGSKASKECLDPYSSKFDARRKPFTIDNSKRRKRVATIAALPKSKITISGKHSFKSGA